MGKLDSNIFPWHLVKLSVRGLEEMFDEEKQLFCFSMIQTDSGLRKHSTSYRYSIISLLGLFRLEAYGQTSSLDVRGMVTSIINQMHKINNIGDLGLLIWLCALSLPERLTELFRALDMGNALRRYGDSLRGQTMELAWFLTGLSYTKLAPNKNMADLHDIAKNTYSLILENYGPNGIFRHMSNRSVIGKLRGRIGSFADQVYPVYALCRFAQAYGDKEALRIALECSRTICSLQGPLGQWWWHYNSATGNVLGRYPVYSVHQDGMAPMALSAIGKVTGVDFTEQICNGINWVTGKNELAHDLTDPSLNVIWRSLFRKQVKQYWELGSSLLKDNRLKGTPNDTKINFECRPYHLGWLLYAYGLTSGKA